MNEYAIRPTGELRPAEYNPRKITQREMDKLIDSIKTYGFVEPVVINFDDTIIGGHQRIKAAEALGLTEVPTIKVDIPKNLEAALNLALNKISGQWDDEKLAVLIATLDAEAQKHSGFDADEIAAILEQTVDLEEKKAVLSEKFLIPPMSILDARQGYWQDRKKKWLALGIESEVGRGENLLNFSDTLIEPDPEKRAAKRLTYVQGDRPVEEMDEVSQKILESGSGTSIFDPVLCELVYRWFCTKGGTVLDPFAGGSVRGIVAALLDMPYTGIELRPEQVAANEAQAEKIVPMKDSLHWITGDSLVTIDTLADQHDLIFSCPPYADLEQYSDDPADISNMAYEDFLSAYREIIKKACAKLKDNRFACFVVGDVRDKNGNYRNFISDTIQAFIDGGLTLYNEAIFITPYGSLPIRAGKSFEASRKLGKTHQNLLVFAKGNPEDTCKLMAPYFEEHRQLADHHAKVLVFAKGDPKAATHDLGPVAVDNDSFVLNSAEE